MAERCLPRHNLVAQSWPKRLFDNWLNHAGPRQRNGEKSLQMKPFRDVRRWASLCLTRPVTPEVAGSSPVAPVKVPANSRIVLSGLDARSAPTTQTFSQRDPKRLKTAQNP